MVLLGTPYCQKCGAPATEVHHVIPLADGGTNDMGNLLPLCKGCHSRVTGRAKGKQ